jgi:putative oxidoreductase
MSGDVAAARGAVTRRPLDLLLWCVQAFLALVFVNASWAKLMGSPEMLALFSAVGVGQWFRYVTGILELTGAVLIMVPKTRRVGAALLATVMLGALAAHLFILHVPPAAPGVLFLVSGFVVWGRRRPSPRPVRRAVVRASSGA